MSSSTSKENSAVKKLQELNIEFLGTVLGTAVKREAVVDAARLGKDEEKQKQLTNFVTGLSIIYIFSFLQSNMPDELWNKIKQHNHKERERFKEKVNWNLFDVFKYVRDCFGHDWQGSLFPKNQSNTQRFQAWLASNEVPYIEVTNDKISLGDGAVRQCYDLALSILEEIE